MPLGAANDLALDQKIIKHEVGRILLIGSNSSRLSGRQKNIIRPHGFEISIHFRAIGQIRLFGRGIDDVKIPARRQSAQQGFANDRLAAGDVDPIRFVHGLTNFLLREVLERQSQAERPALFPL